MYGYQCEYCDGIVRPHRVDREVFKYQHRFVMLEDITVGICDRCGNRYYTAEILHAVHAVAIGERSPERIEEIPVAHLS
jgi:YgiT-type zinc finger domain-containing protein